MTSKGKHQKHPPLKRSNIGHYNLCEWAIYGTNCGDIKSFFDMVSDQLNSVSLVYVDADHGDEQKDTHYHIGKKQFSTRKTQEWSHFDDRLNSIDADAAIINGNHYPAKKQIIIIDDKKKDSLHRRVDQLTDIDIVIVNESEEEIFDFVKDKMNENTQVFLSTQKTELIDHLNNAIQESKPPLRALILAGGKSQRMGFDKSQITYHGDVSQEIHLQDLFKNIGVEAYLSKRYDYVSKVEDELVITDKLVDMGPFGAISSAMMYDPNCAWLVVACDLPFLNKEIITRLIEGRNASKIATAFRGVDNPFPEPLITIYEPRAYQRFLSFLSLGYACPRKVLINSDIEELVLEDMLSITNANTPEEMKAAKQILSNGN